MDFCSILTGNFLHLLDQNCQPIVVNFRMTIIINEKVYLKRAMAFQGHLSEVDAHIIATALPLGTSESSIPDKSRNEHFVVWASQMLVAARLLSNISSN